MRCLFSLLEGCDGAPHSVHRCVDFILIQSTSLDCIPKDQLDDAYLHTLSLHSCWLIATIPSTISKKRLMNTWGLRSHLASVVEEAGTEALARHLRDSGVKGEQPIGSCNMALAVHLLGLYQVQTDSANRVGMVAAVILILSLLAVVLL